MFYGGFDSPAFPCFPLVGVLHAPSTGAGGLGSRWKNREGVDHLGSKANPARPVLPLFDPGEQGRSWNPVLQPAPQPALESYSTKGLRVPVRVGVGRARVMGVVLTLMELPA